MNVYLSCTQKGSALLLVLCAIALMGVTVLGLVEITDLGLQEAASREKDFRAKQLAASGLALGQFPDMEKDDPVLSQKINATESFRVSLKSEGAKLNINWVLQGEHEEILENLFEQWGVKIDERSAIINCLMDWVDADPIARLNGAEQAEYENQGLKGFPPNRPFRNLEEMDRIPALALLAKIKPDWKNYFTLWTDGRLDVNEAGPELIEAVCGVSSMAAITFVDRRRGPDGIDGTSDDFHYEDIDLVKNALGLSQKAFARIENRIALKSDYRRIESVGRVDSYEQKLTVVVQLNPPSTLYLTWTAY